MSRPLCLLLLLLFLTSFSTRGQTPIPDAHNILYVNINVSGGTGDGSSWENAIQNLSDALKWAREPQNNFTNANPLKIYVAKGVYKPKYHTLSPTDPVASVRDYAFVLVNNVQLYGGFDPANNIKTLNDTRILPTDREGLGTVLSGDNGVPNIVTDNVFHVVIAAGDLGVAGLDGFGITAGYAQGIDENAVSVNAYTINRNFGGGIFITHSSPFFTHVAVYGNMASAPRITYGGGIYNEYSNPVFNHVSVYNNTVSANSNAAPYGGGIFNAGSNPVLTNVLVYGNTSSSIASGTIAAAYGGGIANDHSSPVLTNVTIANNRVNGYAGDVSFGGAMYNSASSPQIYNSIIWGNTKFDGNTSTDIEINNDYSDNTIIRNSITQGFGIGNTSDNNLQADPLFADVTGGDFSLENGSPAIDKGNNAFYANTGGNLGSDKDLAGNPRLVGAAIDMGAYENQTVPIIPAGNILYVNTNVSGGDGSGSSWENAIPQLADALKWARLQHNFSAANPLKIYVAQGVYKPMYTATDNKRTSANDRYNAFVLVNNVQLYGGFDPANNIKTLNDARILPTAGEGLGTILSGDIGTAGTVTDNVVHVVIAADAVGVAQLDGFAITGGYANGSTQPTVTVNNQSVNENCGGGIYTIASSPYLTNMAVYGNTASRGGGMYHESSSPVFANLSVHNNTASDPSSAWGGGIMFYLNSQPVLRNVLVYNNTASAGSGSAYGGGIANLISSPVLTNVTIANNHANGTSVGLSSGGGIMNAGSAPAIYNSIFWGNTKFDAGTPSDIEGLTGMTSNLHNSITQTYNTGNTEDNNLVGTDPLFANATIGDFRLQNESPAINNGNNSYYTDADKGKGNLETEKDLAGNPRLFDLVIDMGAYENQKETVVPMSWSAFTAMAEGRMSLLQWRTASESGSSYFEVQRAADGRSFRPLGRVRSVGYSTAEQSYRFVDSLPLTGDNYYRLLQVDFDGKSTQSKIVHLSFSDGGNSWSFYPNPVQDALTLKLAAPATQPGIVLLYDMNGRVLLRQPVAMGAVRVVLHLGQLPSAVYLLRYGNHTEKVIKR